MKTTYLFGAGASYKAIPIVGQLQGAFQYVKTWVDRNSNILDPRGLKLFDALMSIAEINTNSFGTIDTFAKKLWLTHPTDLQKLKAALTVFFSIWQEINVGKFDTIREDTFKRVDDRYIGLVSNFLNKNAKGEIAFDEDVRFITWNYDTQLERAIGLTVDLKLEEVLQKFGVYPSYPSVNYPDPFAGIVHLNGIAGLYRDKGESTVVKSLFGSDAKDDLATKLKRLIDFINEAEDSKVDHAEYFSYAWEDDPISKKAIEYARKTLESTEALIIVGYSFPTFNDKVDKLLFKSAEGVNRIFYQDPDANVEVLSARFGYPKERISIVKKTDQFTMPLDTASFSRGSYSFG
jgi:hypothetical protein